MSMNQYQRTFQTAGIHHLQICLLFFFIYCPCSVRFGQRHGRLCNIAKVWTLSTLVKETAIHYEQSLITILVARVFPPCCRRSQEVDQLPTTAYASSNYHNAVEFPSLSLGHVCYHNNHTCCNNCHQYLHLQVHSLHNACCCTRSHLASLPHICCMVSEP